MPAEVNVIELSCPCCDWLSLSVVPDDKLPLFVGRLKAFTASKWIWEASSEPRFSRANARNSAASVESISAVIDWYWRRSVERRPEESTVAARSFSSVISCAYFDCGIRSANRPAQYRLLSAWLLPAKSS